MKENHKYYTYESKYSILFKCGNSSPNENLK